MNIFINGEAVDMAADATLADVVAAHSRSASGVAAALDMEVVPRSQWATTALSEGARVEIVTAAAGG